MNQTVILTFKSYLIKNYLSGTSLVVQRIRIHLPMQGTLVQPLVQEDSISHGATKPICHNY